MKSKYIKIPIAVMLAMFLTACKLGGEVSGLEDGDAVSLMEDVSGNTVVVDRNGRFEFDEIFMYDRDYQVSVLQHPSGGECHVSNGKGTFSGNVRNVKVECEYLGVCTKEYAPVCAKQKASIQCVTTPCPSHVYKTFGNSCEARQGKAKIAFDDECKTLEGVLSGDEDPARIVDLSVMKFARVATALEAKFDGDVLNVVVGFSGCDDRADIDLYIGSAFMESEPVQVASVFPIDVDHNGDGITCMAYFTKKLRFDLLPLKHRYWEMYGTRSGAVEIQGVGIYKF